MQKSAIKRTVDMQIMADWVETGARVLDLGCGRGVLMEFLGQPVGFQRLLAQVQRLQHPQGRLHQSIIRERTAQAGEPFIGVDGDQRMHTIIGADFIAPAAGGGDAAQASRSNGANFHGLVLLLGRLAQSTI